MLILGILHKLGRGVWQLFSLLRGRNERWGVLGQDYIILEEEKRKGKYEELSTIMRAVTKSPEHGQRPSKWGVSPKWGISLQYCSSSSFTYVSHARSQECCWKIGDIELDVMGKKVSAGCVSGGKGIDAMPVAWMSKWAQQYTLWKEEPQSCRLGRLWWL